MVALYMSCYTHTSILKKSRWQLLFPLKNQLIGIHAHKLEAKVTWTYIFQRYIILVEDNTATSEYFHLYVIFLLLSANNFWIVILLLLAYYVKNLGYHPGVFLCTFWIVFLRYFTNRTNIAELASRVWMRFFQ